MLPNLGSWTLMNKYRLKKQSCTIIPLIQLKVFNMRQKEVAKDQKSEYQNNKEALMCLRQYNKLARAVLELLSESDAWEISRFINVKGKMKSISDCSKTRRILQFGNHKYKDLSAEWVVKKPMLIRCMTQRDSWIEIWRYWTIYYDGRKGTQEWLLFEGKRIVVIKEFEIQHWRISEG